MSRMHEVAATGRLTLARIGRVVDRARASFGLAGGLGCTPGQRLRAVGTAAPALGSLTGLNVYWMHVEGTMPRALATPHGLTEVLERGWPLGHEVSFRVGASWRPPGATASAPQGRVGVVLAEGEPEFWCALGQNSHGPADRAAALRRVVRLARLPLRVVNFKGDVRVSLATHRGNPKLVLRYVDHVGPESFGCGLPPTTPADAADRMLAALAELAPAGPWRCAWSVFGHGHPDLVGVYEKVRAEGLPAEKVSVELIAIVQAVEGLDALKRHARPRDRYKVNLGTFELPPHSVSGRKNQGQLIAETTREGHRLVLAMTRPDTGQALAVGRKLGLRFAKF